MSGSNVLVDVAELAAAAAGSTLIIDCRFTLGRPGEGEQAFLAAHIPGAVYASLDADLSDLSRHGEGRHPLPDAENFSRTVARWGWHPGVPVVSYDAAGGAMAAARLWWMLDVAGIRARVLDGGWQAWQAAGLPVAHGPTAAPAPTDVTLRFDRSRMVDYAELDALRRDPAALVLDARAAIRFRGESEPIDRVAGHVPGARNRPVAENLDASGRLKPAAALRTEFQALLQGRDPARVVSMCGSGVFACQNLLAMEAAGLHGGRVFVPSWSGWSSDPARPVAAGA